MKNAESIDDPLFAFELRIALRADELANDPTMQGLDPVELWCRAERDVWQAADRRGARQPAPLQPHD